MNNNIALLAAIEIISSLTTGVAILFITYKLLQIFAAKKMGITSFNTAFRIFMSGVLFSVGYMISGVIEPILTSFRLLSNQPFNELMCKFLSYSTLYVLVAYLFSLITSLIGVSIYKWLTPIDEFEEIRKDNLGVALVTAVIIITLSLMAKDGVVLLIESLIPYPTLPNL